MANIFVKDEEWDIAQKAIQIELGKLPKGFTGIQKIDRKNKNLEHSFMFIVENGELKKTFAMARKKIVGTEGILGEGAFGVVAIAETRDKHQYAIKIQGGISKTPIGEKDSENSEETVKAEMDLIKAANELEGHGFRISPNSQLKKHYSVMKLKEGSDLFRQLYIPITEERANEVASDPDDPREPLERVGYRGDLDYPDTIEYLERAMPLSLKQKLLLAIKCIEAIQYLHESNIIHRDIKPENIMARFGQGDQKDIIIISPTDFGVSQRLPHGKSEMIIEDWGGTPGYMAPEIQAGILSRANDVYSMGIMFKNDFMLTDEIINGMIEPDYRYRVKLSSCLDYFKEQLREILIEEVGADKADETMSTLLGTEEELKNKLDKNLTKQVTEREQQYTNMFNSTKTPREVPTTISQKGADKENIDPQQRPLKK